MGLDVTSMNIHMRKQRSEYATIDNDARTMLTLSSYIGEVFNFICYFSKVNIIFICLISFHQFQILIIFNKM